MQKEKARTIGQIVADNYQAAEVFNAFDMDFCCGGDRTVDEACQEVNINPNEVWQALKELETDGARQENYTEWSLDFLIDYIINNHHKFSREKLPEIGQYAKKVASVHGDRYPELQKIYYEFTKLHGDIINHLQKEEELLFPYVKRLVEAEKKGKQPKTPDFGKAANPISMMEHEHDQSGAAMEKIRELSDDFTPPDDACTTYRLLFENLEAFEKDLHKHVHLENNILFPKAIELEQSLNR
ncbi:iron-sulfur cluster repair di-iron protein [Fodinibius sediminis]|uniref:Regulator of cell morphogenesis and NO signaling n=1 Tax=Fodinibius sediminis TaxID=1214077 RepID=A0A521ERT0_9BACT|nr:iron-sulfur cluster repair di-iron protein [Fodinibius sediminis]SMO86592.1 regulator of cell morphogenesis and NO signaling [Fodinibius sediminis]